jgi:hypothetical protein
MRRFAKVYESFKKRRQEKIICKITKNNSLNREGYGYIKRRVGLLSSELKSPTYLALSELSEFISKNMETKSLK